MNIQQELAEAQGATEPYIAISAMLWLRMQLAQFALVNGLRNESDALAVVAARYFRMAESERWSGWLNDGEESR